MNYNDATIKIGNTTLKKYYAHGVKIEIECKDTDLLDKLKSGISRTLLEHELKPVSFADIEKSVKVVESNGN